MLYLIHYIGDHDTILQMGQETQQILRESKIASSSGKLFKMAPLSTLQDFLDLGRNTLMDFLAVQQALAFSALGLRLPIIESSKE